MVEYGFVNYVRTLSLSRTSFMPYTNTSLIVSPGDTEIKIIKFKEICVRLLYKQMGCSNNVGDLINTHTHTKHNEKG